MRPRIAISCGVYGEQGRIKPSMTYAESIWRAGGMPSYVPAGFADSDWAHEVVEGADAIVFTGGGDVDPTRYGTKPSHQVHDVDATRDAIETQIIELALQRDLPVLAICRGCQVLNVALGGTLFHDLPSQRPSATKHDYDPEVYPEDEIAHPVDVVAGSRVALAHETDAVLVNSMHHQAIRELGNGLIPTATAPDGITEAVEGSDGWIVGVQWHPERMIHRYPEHLALFRALVEEAARRKDAAPVTP